MGFLGRASSASSSFFSFSHLLRNAASILKAHINTSFLSHAEGRVGGEAGESYGPIQWE